MYYFLGGDQARTQLDASKHWLEVHNAVTVVLFVIFGANLTPKGIPPLTS